VIQFVPVASFASSVLSSKDHPTLVLSALQLVETLLAKVPADYSPAFRREGVFHEIDTIAARPLVAKHKDKDKDARPDTQDDKDVSTSQTPEPFNPPSTTSAPFFTSTPGYKKLSSLAIEPEDAITLRARVIRFRHISSGNELDDSLCDTLHKLVERLSDPIASENDLIDILKELANLFSSPRTSISSFELLQSGVVDSLLSFTTDEGYSGTNLCDTLI
jgi:E3 ubiquitin-protein ligase TRIP12